MSELRAEVVEAMQLGASMDTGLSPAEWRRAVYDCYVHARGVEAVGDWESYQRKPKGYWTRQRCKESAAPHQARKAWQRAEPGAYDTAKRHGWLDECCAHMERQRKPAGWWTRQRCKKSAAPRQTRKAWRLAEPGAYDTARRHGWLDECCAHMERQRNKWTRQRCKESAAPHQTRKAWKLAEPGAYKAASHNGWLDECCAHMKRQIKPPGYWTRQRCKESAAPHQAREAWQLAEHGAYNAARRNGWFDECCAHMERKPKGYWTRQRCKESAAPRQTRKAWRLAEPGAYNAAKRHGWLDECCAHMPKRNP